MNERSLIEILNKKEVFSIQDIRRVGNFSVGYSKLVLNRLVKRRAIKRVTRNVYTTKKNLLVVASNIKVPAYLSFWSASSYYGLTEQILKKVYVATSRRVNSISFEDTIIKFVDLSAFFGYKKITSPEGTIFIVEQEKLLIDSLTRPKEMGNFDEIEKVFQNSEIDLGKFISYLKRINDNSLIKRAGFLVEKHKGADISKYFKLDRNYVLLNSFSRKHKSLNSKWRVLI